MTYRLSDAWGSFVPVLAHRRRCGRAPSFARRCQRSEARSFAVGSVGPLRDGDAELEVEFLRHVSCDRRVPAAHEDGGDRAERAGVEPALDPSFDAAQVGFGAREVLLCREESVTLTGTPAWIVSSMAARPAGVPGILMKRFGRPAFSHSLRASLIVVPASFASRGETSSETQPSTPWVRSKIGRKASAASRDLRWREVEEDAFAREPVAVQRPDRGVIGIGSLDRLVVDRRVRREPGDREARRCTARACDS